VQSGHYHHSIEN